MALFQKSVVNKYLAELDKVLLEKQYGLFKNYFLNDVRQKNIIASKEEEFQEGFLRELFVNIFGYTINPEPDYNLKTELKNVKDSKKADGAIVDNSKVLAVIELKGTETINLNQVEIQAFNYKNNQEGCRFVVTSNFQKLRFYIDNAIDHLEWDLFRLDYEGFKLLYLCLSKESVFKNLPATIKEESLSEEESITKKLYKEYSNFRKALFNNIAHKNPQFDKLLLFKKTQKLLDRFLFLFFAEDRNLLPPNSVRMILDQWTKLKEEYDEYQALYERFKKYFGYLNTGYIGKTHEIFAYNGGLFATDEILDALQIDDATLYEATLSLSRYDYNSDVDVNILGHIFEHSLTEIEELEAEITEGGETDKSKISKRKKDGVFYTPKYITKYIVENTVGTLCTNKKQELQIADADYHPLQKKNTVKKLFAKLNQYREWLLHVTIVDPACGSGAFLNQALEFLIAEHKFISELEANITGSSIVFDVENSILENNLFGVDINEESVEIAKLSLWLRTARKGRKLNSLNNNIKCGNSLIDDVSVAGDKAFSWQKEFPQVFGEYIKVGLSDIQKTTTTEEITEAHPASEPRAITNYDEAEAATNNTEQITNDETAIVNTDFKIVNEPIVEYNIQKKVKRGFDVVIGNPPYGAKLSENHIDYYRKEYQTVTGHSEAYYLFIEKSRELVNQNSYVGYIIPNAWLSNKYAIEIRKLILKNMQILALVNLNKKDIFTDANVETCIIILSNRMLTQKQCLIGNSIEKLTKFDYSEWLNNRNNIISFNANDTINTIIRRINSNNKKLSDYLDISNGFKPYQVGYGYNFNNEALNTNEVENKIYHSPVKTDDFFQKEIKGKGIHRYSLKWEPNYIKWGKWLMSPKDIKYFVEPKILIRQIISDYFFASLDLEQYFADQSLYICINYEGRNEDLSYFLALINSRLYGFYFRKFYSEEDDLFPKIKVNELKNLPVKDVEKEKQQIIAEKANTMLSKNIQLHQANKQFTQLLSSKFPALNINTKLDKWYTLSFADFSKELSKQKIKLTLQEQREWLSFFEMEKQKALVIKNEIDITDRQIDKMVYELYQLTDEEIKIIEGD